MMEFDASSARFGFVLFLGVVVLLEAFLLIRRGKSDYPWDHTATSFGVTLIKRGVDAATAGLFVGILFWAYDHRITTLEVNTPLMALACFLTVEFVYYWHHRWAHEIRWLWATHAVHHSAPYMNLSVAGRLGWTSLISGSAFVFAAPALIGFHPLAIAATLAAGLFYQLWIHTELVPRLGPLERVLNTPSNHRVHHASNPEYIDKNYGSVLMIFDVLFGTYQSERDDVKVRYGLVEPMESRNPIAVGLFEWGRMARDARKARSVREFLGYTFGRPGWKPAPADQMVYLLGPPEASNAAPR